MRVPATCAPGPPGSLGTAVGDDVAGFSFGGALSCDPPGSAGARGAGFGVGAGPGPGCGCGAGVGVGPGAGAPHPPARLPFKACTSTSCPPLHGAALCG
ncbi:MAG: hypothetical protein ACJ734_06510 [Gaiellaceae bacterium]